MQHSRGGTAEGWAYGRQFSTKRCQKHTPPYASRGGNNACSAWIDDGIWNRDHTGKQYRKQGTHVRSSRERNADDHSFSWGLGRWERLGKIINSLQDHGYTVLAPAVGLGLLSGDIAAARKFISDVPGPKLLVGHSYGGAVITGAATDLPNVTGLVYLAAFALDQGESLLGLNNQFGQQYGPALAGQFLRPDGPFENPQTLVYLDRANFGQAFVQDIDPERAAVLAATQRPIAVAAFGEPLSGIPAWRQVRSWYQVSTQDRVIQPDGERWMAQRSGAEVIELDTSHASLIARPQAIAKLIKRAARA
ncbi:MAG: alpha/beta hydrolase [Roseiflexaceae bacterium]|nr:alpha/beta hydrolase [Roseiflexaceae bacterium]